jgi:hypothetical protein
MEKLSKTTIKVNSDDGTYRVRSRNANHYTLIVNMACSRHHHRCLHIVVREGLQLHAQLVFAVNTFWL